MPCKTVPTLALALAPALAPTQAPSPQQRAGDHPSGRPAAHGVSLTQPAATPATRRGGSTPPKAVAGAGLLAPNGRGSLLTPGGLAAINQSSFTGTLIADPITPNGLTGLTCTPDGRLWGSAGDVNGADLVELNPVTGAVISQVPITHAGSSVRISDLACHPLTGVIYACGRRIGGDYGEIFTIDKTTGVSTFLGQSGVFNDGGLAFDAAGTLYLLSALVANPALATLDPTTGFVLTSVNYGPATALDGLVVRPSDGALLATRGGTGGTEQIVRIDPVTGLTTELGATGTGRPSDLAFRSCQSVGSSTTVRLGTPPNPNAYLPGTQGPIIGTVWDPRIDHTTFLPAAVFDFAAFSGTATNVPLPIGVLLCALPVFGVQAVGASSRFAFPIPADCALLGTSLCSQGGSITAIGVIELTNALDVVVGSV